MKALIKLVVGLTLATASPLLSASAVGSASIEQGKPHAHTPAQTSADLERR